VKPYAKEITAGALMIIYFAILFLLILGSITGCASDPRSHLHNSSPDTYIQGASGINDQIENKAILLEHSR